MDSQEAGKILGPHFEAVARDSAIALKELGLPDDAAVLDVGTGSGDSAIYLALQGHRVVTGEPSTDTSHYAGKDWAPHAESVGVLDKIRFQAFDAKKMPFESGAFDAVFFFGVLHHIDEKDRGDVLREALRVLKDNGVAVFFEPRKNMLEKLRVNDPGHPPAANPSDYLAGRSIRKRRIEGFFMDIFIYENAV